MRQIPIGTLAVASAVGAIGAAGVGFTVGFHDTEDPAAGAVRLGGALLTGFVAGLVGKGIWGWVAVSAGATVAVLPFALAVASETSTAFGIALLSFIILAPGYGLGRAVVLALRLPALSVYGRSVALRAPLRRLLRVGVVLSGGAAMMVAVTAGALGGSTEMLVGGAVGIAGFFATYALYRLIDRLDRGESRPAIVFSVFYGALGIGWFVVMVAAGAHVGWALGQALVPSSFMALSPWLLARLARNARAGEGPRPQDAARS